MKEKEPLTKSTDYGSDEASAKVSSGPSEAKVKW